MRPEFYQNLSLWLLSQQLIASIFHWWECSKYLPKLHYDYIGTVLNVENIFRELKSGVPVSDENGVVYGNSVRAAQEGIGQVTLSRIFMACPGKFSRLSHLLFISFNNSAQYLKAWSWHPPWLISLKTKRRSWSAIVGPTRRFKSCSAVCAWHSPLHFAVPCSRKRRQFPSTAWNWSCATRFTKKVPDWPLFPITKGCNLLRLMVHFILFVCWKLLFSIVSNFRVLCNLSAIVTMTIPHLATGGHWKRLQNISSPFRVHHKLMYFSIETYDSTRQKAFPVLSSKTIYSNYYFWSVMLLPQSLFYIFTSTCYFVAFI